MELSEIVDSYIKEHGISIRELARRSDLSAQIISNIIRNKNSDGKPFTPKLKTLEKLSSGMGIRLADLIAPEDRERIAEDYENRAMFFSGEADETLDEDEKLNLRARSVASLITAASIRLGPSDGEPKEIITEDDRNLMEIRNAARKLSPENRKMLLKYMQFTFPEAFE